MVEARIGAEYVHLDRGDTFDIELTFKYKGHPQKLTFELKMRTGLFATEYSCVNIPAINVGGALDWGTVGPITLTYKVPPEAKDGDQDLKLYIKAEDGERDESGWLSNAIFVGV